MQKHPISKAVVPKGAFEFEVPGIRETRWFNFLLLPQFTLLAFSAALDPLRIANQIARKPLYGWEILSQDGSAVFSSSGVDVNVSGGLEAINKSATLFVCSGNNGIEAANNQTVNTVRSHLRHGGRVGGVCTGASTLARAGLLNNRRFTLHWENQPGFHEAFPDLQSTDTRFEVDGNILTCGGGEAASELILSLISQDYGNEFAFHVSEMCLSASGDVGHRRQRSSLATAINHRNPKIVKALQVMQDNIEDPLTLEEVAKNVGSSRRQMERLFRTVFDASPWIVYRSLRLERGRMLLNETEMTVVEVSMACGFSSASHFTKSFKAEFGTTPTQR